MLSFRFLLYTLGPNMLRFWKISYNIFGTIYFKSLDISGTEYIVHMKIFHCMVLNILQTLVLNILRCRIYLEPSNSLNPRYGIYYRGSTTGTEYIPQQHFAPEYIKNHVTTAP